MRIDVRTLSCSYFNNYKYIPLLFDYIRYNEHINYPAYFVCFFTHTKTLKKLQLLPGIEPHPQRCESRTLNTAPIPLTNYTTLMQEISLRAQTVLRGVDNKVPQLHKSEPLD